MTSKPNKQHTKAQHVIPQFYLKKFYSEDERLQVFYKERGNFGKEKTAKSIGYDLYFYAEKTGVGDNLSQDVENALKAYEDFIAPRYEGICQKILANQHISDEDRYVLGLFGANLFLRGYSLRSQIEGTSDQLAEQIIRLWLSNADARKSLFTRLNINDTDKLTVEEMSRIKEYVKRKHGYGGNNLMHTAMLTHHQGFANMLAAKKIRAFIADRKHRFITGDVPTLEVLPKYAAPQSIFGWHFMERLHVLPLSSDIMIEFHDPSVLSGKAFIRRRIEDHDVARANVRQLAGAIVWCAGSSREDFFTGSSKKYTVLPVATHKAGTFDENFLRLAAG